MKEDIIRELWNKTDTILGTIAVMGAAILAVLIILFIKVCEYRSEVNQLKKWIDEIAAYSREYICGKVEAESSDLWHDIYAIMPDSDKAAARKEEETAKKQKKKKKKVKKDEAQSNS